MRFRDSLNISVDKIRRDHLECSAVPAAPDSAFFFISFIWEVGVLAWQRSSAIKLKCRE